MNKTKKYKKDNWNRPMGDADNELLSNYDINKENIKIKNTRELVYIRKSK